MDNSEEVKVDGGAEVTPEATPEGEPKPEGEVTAGELGAQPEATPEGQV